MHDKAEVLAKNILVVINKEDVAKYDEAQRYQLEKAVGVACAKIVAVIYQLQPSPQTQQLVSKSFTIPNKVTNGLFGKDSDARHHFYLELDNLLFPLAFRQQQSFFGKPFIEHIQSKFQDTTKQENLDAQIFYYTEQVRRDTTVFDNESALLLLPKLVQLLGTFTK